MIHSENDDLLFESDLDIDNNLVYTGVISADLEDSKDIVNGKLKSIDLGK
jgi:predicted RNA-binding protein